MPQTAGIETTISSDGLIMSASSPTEWHTASVMIAADGAVVTDLNARADGSMGSMAISYPRVEEAIAATAAVAQDLWAVFPAAHRIRADVGSNEPVQRLAIHVKRAFADHGALID